MPEVGRKPPDENHTQSVLFYRDAGWTVTTSKKWLKDHDYYVDGLDETDALLRYRQYDPDDDKYRYVQKTIEEKDGKPSIAFVLAFKKGNQMTDRQLLVWRDKINSVMNNLIVSLFSLFRLSSRFHAEEQAISMPDIYDAVAWELAKLGDIDDVYRRLIDCYVEGGETYALVGMEGKLYKILLTVTDDGISLADPQLIIVEHKPVSQAVFQVVKQADGKHRWFAFPAATAVLNNNGYLNSRALYDSFVKYAEETGEYPYLTFYHVGEKLQLGRADFVAREEYTYLVSGLFDEDSPLAQMLIQDGVSDKPQFGGVSIGYQNDEDSIEMLKISDGVEIPVHTSGMNMEVSALEPLDAACILTGYYVQTKETNMNQATLKKLKKLAGENPEANAIVDSLADQVDQTNAKIEGENLIRQQAAKTAPVVTPDPVVPDPAAPEPEGEKQVIQLTEEAMDALAVKVAEHLAEKVADKASVETLAMDATKKFEDMTSQIAALTERVAALEQPLEQAVQQALADMPRSRVIVTGYRPTQQIQTVEQPVTSEDVAAETLANLKQGAS